MHILIKEKVKELCYAKHLKLSAVIETLNIKRNTLNMMGAARLDRGKFIPVITLREKQIKALEELLDCHRGEFLLNVKLLNNVLSEIRKY